MNILVTGSNGYIGKSILNSKIEGITFFQGNRQTIDLFNIESIKTFIKQNKIDCIAHCAIEGVNRLKTDDAKTFYNNLLIFENIYSCKNLFHKLINFASGAEFDMLTDICLRPEEDIFRRVPKDYYGLSKNIIAKKCLSINNFYNLRIFGCFDENELETRFIKSCILKSKKNEPIVIYEDKRMDFFYLKDLINVTSYFLFSESCYKDINLSYEHKYKLSEIADIIVCENKSKSKILINNKNGLNYNGDFIKLKNLNLNLNGFKNGLQKTINNLK